ncbi:hypothetical protein B0H13DRAFT_2368576 [Mycena leptocephala]|nr:hypothetical protein B0H13DRAFT_2368576 [Mycena leptocephala]
MGPDIDHNMSDATALSPRRDEREVNSEDSRAAKRIAVPTPRRDLFDQMRRSQAENRVRIQRLEVKLEALKALAKETEEHAQFLVHELKQQKSHQDELEGQFMTDQATESFERAAGSMVEAQKQLMFQNQTIQQLQRDMADRTIENIGLKAKLRAPSGTTERRARTTKFPVLRNIGTTVHIPLDPVPLPGPPASSTEGPQDAPSVKMTVTKKWSKLAKAKPRKPVSQEEITYWNHMLRKPIYDNFGVKGWSDFMHHVPVTPQERKASVVPTENDWRMDFSEGYNSSHWNIETPPPDADWLDEQVKTKFQAMQGAWVRLLPKPKADGGMETMDEAAARTIATMEAEHNKRKSNSAKERKYKGRILMTLLTIEIKTQRGEADIGAWERLLAIIQKLGVMGMSSEEEDEAEFEGEPMTIYRVKICIWRNPDIVDYMRFVNKQRKLDANQCGNLGPNKMRRMHTQDFGTSRAPTGLPECIYNNTWLKELQPLEYEDLQVSKEVFEMLVAATSRMLRAIRIFPPTSVAVVVKQPAPTQSKMLLPYND